MKEFKITEEQIKELAKSNSKVKKWFPEVFETKLEVGKWYKYNGWLINYKGIEDSVLRGKCAFDKNNRFDSCEFSDCFGDSPKEWVLATEEEVFEALKNEAIKRYKSGDEFLDARYNSNKYEFNKKNRFELRKDGALCIERNGNGTVFYNGKWASVVEKTMTKEEAEKKLNVKIID